MQWVLLKLHQDGLEDLLETDFGGLEGALSWRVPQPVHERTDLSPCYRPHYINDQDCSWLFILKDMCILKIYIKVQECLHLIKPWLELACWLVFFFFPDSTISM